MESKPMTPENFCYWLRGYLTVCFGETTHMDRWAITRELERTLESSEQEEMEND